MQTLLSDKEKIYEWARSKKLFSYIDIRDWGIENFCLNADRRVRELVEEGLLKRVSREEALLRGLIKEGRAQIAFFELV